MRNYLHVSITSCILIEAVKMSSELSNADLGLPNPFEASDPDLQEMFNRLRREQLLDSQCKKRKRAPGGNRSYPEELKARVASTAIQMGSAVQASKKFHMELGYKIRDTTIHGWMKKYEKQLSAGEDVSVIKSEKRGAPTHVPRDVEDRVMREIRAQSAAGCHVSNKSVIAFAMVAMERLHPVLAKKLKLKKSWSQSFFRRMKWVRRKVTRAARLHIDNPELVAREFYKKIKRIIRQHNIPAELLMNADQSGCRLVPSRTHTMAERGSRQVSINGKDDKRGVTALFGSTITGHLLPPQIIYEGKSSRCHPRNKKKVFPRDWDITATKNHWSTVDSMVLYVKNVLVSYCEDQRTQLGLPDDQKALLILNTYRPHTNSVFGEACDAANICRVYVPPGCTATLQPLDAAGGVNQVIKQHLATEYDSYYANYISTYMGPDGSTPEGWTADMKMSTIKPYHAEWLVTSFKAVEKRKKLIKKGWKKTGIIAAIEHLI